MKRRIDFRQSDRGKKREKEKIEMRWDGYNCRNTAGADETERKTNRNVTGIVTTDKERRKKRWHMQQSKEQKPMIPRRENKSRRKGRNVEYERRSREVWRVRRVFDVHVITNKKQKRDSQCLVLWCRNGRGLWWLCPCPPKEFADITCRRCICWSARFDHKTTKM